MEIVNDDPDGSKGTIVLGLTGLRFEDEEKKRLPVSARIQIPEDFRGELEINTVSGNIRIPRFEGESLEVATVSGDLDGGTIRGAVEGESVSGDLSIEKAAAGAELSTVSGKMTIGEALGDISMESVSGEILVERAEDPRFKFEAQWVSGGLETDFDGSWNGRKWVPGGSWTEETAGKAERTFPGSSSPPHREIWNVIQENRRMKNSQGAANGDLRITSSVLQLLFNGKNYSSASSRSSICFQMALISLRESRRSCFCSMASPWPLRLRQNLFPLHGPGPGSAGILWRDCPWKNGPHGSWPSVPGLFSRYLWKQSAPRSPYGSAGSR